MHDQNDNGVLDSDESKVFFQKVMDFNYETAVSRLNYRKIMRLVDPENTRKITKDAVIEFFSLPGFLRYEELVDLNDSNPAQEQKRKEYCAVSTNSDPIYMPEDGFK